MYRVTATKDGKQIQVDRALTVDAFRVAKRLRLLGYRVKVDRPGSTSMETRVLAALLLDR